MKSRLATSLALVVCLLGISAAQEKRAATIQRGSGRVIALTQSEITIQPGTRPNLVLAIDGTTKVVGKGVGTKTQALKREGRPVTVPDLVDRFDSVTVKYVDEGGKLRVTEIDIRAKTTLKK